MLKFWSWVLILFLFLSCKNKNGTPSTDTEKLNLALHFAGSNSAELRKVLDHYSADRKDSLKLRAAYFLINNMIGKGYSQYQEVNSIGSCSYDLFNRNIGIDSICYFKKRYEDSTHSGRIIFTNPVFKEDIKSIKSSELIENIDLAFMAWKFPWAKALTFGEFEELVLPYRVEKEPLQNWRKYFFMNSKWILDRAGGTTDRIKIAGIINDSLKRRYKYTNDAISFFPGTFTLRELNASGGGRCGDLNTIAAYWLRAIGIPTASEFTPFWSNSNYGGHSWLSILDGNGKFVPMNAVYDNPVRDSLPFKDAYLAKAYRWKYALRPGFYTSHQYYANFYDITKEYLPVVNYAIRLPTSVADTDVFIGVLNGPYWKPLETRKVRHGDSLTFVNIARNVLYAPIRLLNNGRTKTCGTPFFVHKSGKTQEFVEDTSRTVAVTFDISSLSNSLYGKKCRVVYWDNNQQGWIPTGVVQTLKYQPKEEAKKIPSAMITFKDVTSNAIYRVINSEVAPKGSAYGRPFIYDNELSKFIDY